MNSSFPDTIALDDEYWQNFCVDFATGDTAAINVDPLALDFPITFDHLFEQNSSDDIPKKPAENPFYIYPCCHSVSGADHPAHISHTIEDTPHLDPEISDLQKESIGHDISSVVERLNQELKSKARYLERLIAHVEEIQAWIFDVNRLCDELNVMANSGWINGEMSAVNEQGPGFFGINGESNNRSAL